MEISPVKEVNSKEKTNNLTNKMKIEISALLSL
jgi:hypothetical protein